MMIEAEILEATNFPHKPILEMPSVFLIENPHNFSNAYKLWEFHWISCLCIIVACMWRQVNEM